VDGIPPIKPVGKGSKEVDADPCVTLEGEKAYTINLFSFGTVQMRAFHLAWFSFFMVSNSQPFLRLSSPTS